MSLKDHILIVTRNRSVTLRAYRVSEYKPSRANEPRVTLELAIASFRIHESPTSFPDDVIYGRVYYASGDAPLLPLPHFRLHLDLDALNRGEMISIPQSTIIQHNYMNSTMERDGRREEVQLYQVGTVSRIDVSLPPGFQAAPRQPLPSKKVNGPKVDPKPSNPNPKSVGKQARTLALDVHVSTPPPSDPRPTPRQGASYLPNNLRSPAPRSQTAPRFSNSSPHASNTMTKISVFTPVPSTVSNPEHAKTQRAQAAAFIEVPKPASVPADVLASLTHLSVTPTDRSTTQSTSHNESWADSMNDPTPGTSNVEVPSVFDTDPSGCDDDGLRWISPLSPEVHLFPPHDFDTANEFALQDVASIALVPSDLRHTIGRVFMIPLSTVSAKKPKMYSYAGETPSQIYFVDNWSHDAACFFTS